MAVDIKVPAPGESVTEGFISAWFKKTGDYVQAQEPVFELESDKAAIKVTAPAAGVLTIAVGEGQQVPVGAVVGRIDEKAAAPAAAKPAVNPAPAATAPVSEPALSPAARLLASEAGLDASKIAGTGRGGRVIKEDVLAALPKAKEATAAPARRELENGPAASAPVKPAGERETRKRMTTIRQRIAERLVAAQRSAAILTTFNEADMSAVMALRARYKEPFQKKHGVGLGYMSFFISACVEALRTYPTVNARIDGSDVVYHHYIDIGVAVSTERGLMVPVLRGCERLSFAQIEKGIAELAQKARDDKIAIADLQGGTFTITNGGVFGSLLSTPIVNPPQSAILGMHTIQKRPVAVEDQVVIRPMMYLALSYDHRLIDGREAVAFLVRVKECVESPERLLLEI